jgi:hypothetical protein
MPTYLSKDIADLTLWGRIERAVENDARLLGEVWQARTIIVNDKVEGVLRLTAFQETNAGRKALRDFFDDHEGASIAFWVKSDQEDFTTAAAASSGASSITLLDYAIEEGLSGLARHVYIPALDQCVEISNPAPSGGNVTVDVDPVLSGDLAAGAEIQALRLCRFEGDVLEIESHEEIPGATTAALALRELQGES